MNRRTAYFREYDRRKRSAGGKLFLPDAPKPHNCEVAFCDGRRQGMFLDRAKPIPRTIAGRVLAGIKWKPKQAWEE